MKRIDTLDFYAPRPAPWGGWLLAGVGLAALAWAAWPLAVLQQDNLLREQSLAAIAPAGDAEAAARPGSAASDRAAAAGSRELLQRLNAPWDELFALLEHHAHPAIGLLQLQPDAAARQFKLTALARDLGTIVAWVHQLQSDPRLDEVLLLQHQREEQTPGMPVRFSVTARWRPAPALPPAADRAAPAASADSAASAAGLAAWPTQKPTLPVVPASAPVAMSPAGRSGMSSGMSPTVSASVSVSPTAPTAAASAPSAPLTAVVVDRPAASRSAAPATRPAAAAALSASPATPADRSAAGPRPPQPARLQPPLPAASAGVSRATVRPATAGAAIASADALNLSGEEP